MMSAIRPRIIFLALLAALATWSTACKIDGKPRPFAPIGAEAEALRAAFNADAGAVRVIVLVAPT
jgi:hypothetical protein